jgi:hypothetical protein
LAKLQATREEKAQRLDLVGQWITEGWGRAEIVAECAKKWGITDSTGDRYIREVRVGWAENYDATSRHEMMSQIMKRYEHIYREAVRHKQYAAAMACNQAMAKMTRCHDANIDG